jgi:inositol transport system permease protein
MQTTGETKAATADRSGLNNFVRKYLIVLILLGLVIVLSAASPAFMTPRNVLNVIRQISVVGVIAIGMTMIIITGGIDLSPGSVVALATVVAASFAQRVDWSGAKYPGLDLPLIVPILAALAVGGLCGVINGSLIAKFKIPPFIATLGMMTVARGFALIYSDRPVSGLKAAYNFMGQGEVLSIPSGPNQTVGIPVPVIVLAVVAIAIHYMLNNMRFGRYIYAIGGNEQAARISGLNLDSLKIRIYGLAGLLYGVSALLLSARIGSGQPGLAVGYELDAIAAAVIGGTSLSGGIGTVWGTIVGALIIGVINNGMDLINVNAYWQTIVKGSIIVIAVIIDTRKNA